MSSWSGGYVTEIGYTQGYYRELSPVLLRHVALHRGIDARTPRAPRYLELGFGQGLSLAIHAASCPGEYWGTDFNPSHAAAARALLDAAGVAAHIHDSAFAELAAEDLPEFDVIALHGIWSWVSDDNRAVIVDLIRRRLAFGGLLYISYNALPGWAPVVPMRDLLKMHADLAGTGGHAIAQRIDQAIDFTQRVIDTGAGYFAAHPALAARLRAMRGQDPHYLAHEYFNRDWLPMSFSDIAERMAGAKLEFVASADLLDQVDVAHLTPEMQALLGELGHPILRETVRDYMVNRQFRKDVFVRGRRPLTGPEQRELFLAERFALLVPFADVPLTLNVGTREVALQQAVYHPLLQIMAEQGYRPKTIGEILAHPGWEGHPLASLLQALAVLTGAGFAAPAQADDVIEAARPRCAALNRHLLARARYGAPVTHLASPVSGGGVALGRFQQLFLAAHLDGATTPAAMADAAWRNLDELGQRILQDGRTLETPAENLAELTTQAEAFARRWLAVLEGLVVA